MDASELEKRIRAGIPLSAGMDFRIRALSDLAITVWAGAAENVNVHGTAFAGSLYTACTLAAWGLVTSRLPYTTSLVLADASIRYLKPVVGEIVATCTIPPELMAEFMNSIEQHGKGRLQAHVTVAGEEQHAVEFYATLYARKDSY